MFPLLLFAPSNSGVFVPAVPATIDAIRFLGINGDEVEAWSGGLVTVGVSVVNGVSTAAVGVPAPGGMQVAGPGDWIVRASSGNLFAISGSAFAATYQPLVS